MADVFAVMFVTSVPFFLIVLSKRGVVLVSPSSRIAKAVLMTILFGNVFLAAGGRFGYRLMLFNTPLFIWGGFLLFCFLWIRGIYLLRTKSIQNRAGT